MLRSTMIGRSGRFIAVAKGVKAKAAHRLLFLSVRRCRPFHCSRGNPYKLDRPNETSPFRRTTTTGSKEQKGGSPNNNATTSPTPEETAPTVSLFQALFRPVLVSSVISLGSFGLAAIWDYEEEENQQQKQLQRQAKKQNQREETTEDPFVIIVESTTTTTTTTTPEDANHHDPNNLHTPSSSTTTTNKKSPLLFFSPVIPPQYKSWWIEEINHDPKAHTVGPLILADFAVINFVSLSEYALFGFGKQAAIRGQDFFRNNLVGGRALPIILAPFGHGGLLHFGLSSIFLWKYSDHLIQQPQLLNGSTHTFWASYVSAGTIAAVGGILVERIRNKLLGPSTKRIVFPQFKAPLATFASPYTILFAYYFSCPEYQNKLRTINILGRWEWRIPVADAIWGLVVVDCFGLVLGHRVFGNSIHLSAAALGYYAINLGGIDQIKSYQRYIVQQYTATK